MEKPDFFYKRYENICISGGFDNTPENSDMINFINDHCLMDFAKKNRLVLSQQRMLRMIYF